MTEGVWIILAFLAGLAIGWWCPLPRRGRGITLNIPVSKPTDKPTTKEE